MVKRVLLLVFLSLSLSGLQAQYINIYLSDSTTESYALADVSNLTFGENLMQMSFVGGSQLHWNTSIINYIDYEDSGLGIAQPTADLVQTFLMYPNPSNSFVNVKLASRIKGEVSIVIFNLNGQVISNLYQGESPKGESEWRWNGEDLSGNRVKPGMYLCTVFAQNQRISRTIILTE